MGDKFWGQRLGRSPGGERPRLEPAVAGGKLRDGTTPFLQIENGIKVKEQILLETLRNK
jgi:hypothetical protein